MNGWKQKLFSSERFRFLFSGSIFPVKWLPEEANEMVLVTCLSTDLADFFKQTFFLFNALRSIEVVLVPFLKQVGYRQRNPTKLNTVENWFLDRRLGYEKISL